MTSFNNLILSKLFFSMLWVQNLQQSYKTAHLNSYQISDLVELFLNYFPYCLVYQLVLML